MFYVKNVPTWERILRIVMGVVALVFAVMNWGTSGLAVGAWHHGGHACHDRPSGFLPHVRHGGPQAR